MNKVLTSTQQTFVDLYDSYSISMSPEVFAVDCDINGNTIAESEFTINYSVNANGTPINAKLFKVECANESIQFAETSYGTISVKIKSGVMLIAAGTISAKITIETLDKAAFQFERYITFMKSSSGSDGESAVSFQIYSPTGDIFKEDVSEITIKTAAFCGSSGVDGATYEWFYHDDDWIPIDNTDPELEVGKGALYAFSTIKCVMHYNNIDYEDYILLKSANAYSAEIKFLSGDSMFGELDDTIIAYVALYKDGKEIDPLVADIYFPPYGSEPELDTDGDTQIVYVPDMMPGSYAAGKKFYFICRDNSVVLAMLEENSAEERWVVQECHSDYNYVNTFHSDINSKFLIVHSSDVAKSIDVDFYVYKATDDDINNSDLLIANISLTIKNLKGFLENTVSTANNVDNYFDFTPKDGLIIGERQKNTFYTQITAKEMNFVDNSSGTGDVVVTIGQKMAKIINMEVDGESGANFKCKTTFQKPVYLGEHFALQLEENGSLSLVSK